MAGMELTHHPLVFRKILHHFSVLDEFPVDFFDLLTFPIVLHLLEHAADRNLDHGKQCFQGEFHCGWSDLRVLEDAFENSGEADHCESQATADPLLQVGVEASAGLFHTSCNVVVVDQRVVVPIREVRPTPDHGGQPVRLVGNGDLGITTSRGLQQLHQVVVTTSDAPFGWAMDSTLFLRLPGVERHVGI